MEKNQLQLLLNILLKKVTIVTHDELQSVKDEAKDIIGTIDPDDSLIIACALTNPGSAIWSNDKKLKSQYKIPIYSTSEFIEYLRK